MNNKLAQAWGFDLIVASAIFITGVIFFYLFAVNYPSDKETFEELFSEGEILTNSLLSEGFPQAWTENNVEKIGILSGDAINATKLERFYNLSVNNYQKTKSLFKIKNNYYVNFSGNVNVSGLEIDGIGLSGENSNNLVSVTRITNYNNEIITIEADVWN